jgi:hypothetical protein
MDGVELLHDHLLFAVSVVALLVIFICVWLLFREYFQWRRNMDIMLRRARQPLLIVVIVRKVFGRRAKVEKVIAGQLDEDFSATALRRQIARSLAEPIEPEAGAGEAGAREAGDEAAKDEQPGTPPPPVRDPRLF